MATLECYELPLVTWHILSGVADAFMTVDDANAIGVMRRLGDPRHGDPAVAAGESGGVGLVGCSTLLPTRTCGVFLINTEGATDPRLYEELVGRRHSR
ncbi:hypothetical protein XI01_05240 [Bradyrhizobium sp. CCBAU 21360]|nr:hypothetical protein [Bradyrhizobium sp. CCBAU 21360]